MNFEDLFYETFIIEGKERNLLLLDIDETLVKPQNIFIYKKTDAGEVTLTPEQYAKEVVTPETKKLYDYRDFRNPEKIAGSIKTGLPIISNLRLVDKYINAGWTIGILTARAMEETVFKSLREWLMYRNEQGDLRLVGDKLVRDLVHAVNDDTKKYPGRTDFEKKARVIQQLAKRFDKVLFIDDTKQTLEAVKNLNLSNVHVLEAKKYDS